MQHIVFAGGQKSATGEKDGEKVVWVISLKIFSFMDGQHRELECGGGKWEGELGRASNVEEVRRPPSTPCWGARPPLDGLPAQPFPGVVSPCPPRPHSRRRWRGGFCSNTGPSPRRCGVASPAPRPASPRTVPAGGRRAPGVTHTHHTANRARSEAGAS